MRVDEEYSNARKYRGIFLTRKEKVDAVGQAILYMLLSYVRLSLYTSFLKIFNVSHLSFPLPFYNHWLIYLNVSSVLTHSCFLSSLLQAVVCVASPRDNKRRHNFGFTAGTHFRTEKTGTYCNTLLVNKSAGLLLHDTIRHAARMNLKLQLSCDVWLSCRWSLRKASTRGVSIVIFFRGISRVDLGNQHILYFQINLV